jgi:hypothetical protein
MDLRVKKIGWRCWYAANNEWDMKISTRMSSQWLGITHEALAAFV